MTIPVLTSKFGRVDGMASNKCRSCGKSTRDRKSNNRHGLCHCCYKIEKKWVKEGFTYLRKQAR